MGYSCTTTTPLKQHNTRTHLSHCAFFSLISACSSAFCRTWFSSSASTAFRMPIAWQHVKATTATIASDKSRNSAGQVGRGAEHNCQACHMCCVRGREGERPPWNNTLSFAVSMADACFDSTSTSDRTVPLKVRMPASERGVTAHKSE